MNTCSRKLMRTALKHFSDQMNSSHLGIISSRDALHDKVNSRTFSSIRGLIHRLNSSLYENLIQTKASNLDRLIPKINVLNSRRLIVTIPEDFELSPKEVSVLSVGDRYVPTPYRCDETTTRIDTDRFFRNVKLHVHFNDPNQAFIDTGYDEDEFTTFKKAKSKWTPKMSTDAVNTFVNRCKEEINLVNFKLKKRSSNFTIEERSVLTNLQSRDDVIIKRADKGGTIVVWRKDLYIAEVERQLLDATYYDKIETDTTVFNNEKVAEVIHDEIKRGNLPDTALNLVDNSKCSVFYMLPKIHKAGNPGCPIVSTCSCPTENISEYLDSILHVLVQGLPIYVKDTKDTVIRIDGLNISSSSNIITMDVKKPYTQIPNNDSLKALKHFLDKRPVQFPPTCTILRLAELVLTLNQFELNSEYYV